MGTGDLRAVGGVDGRRDRRSAPRTTEDHVRGAGTVGQHVREVPADLFGGLAGAGQEDGDDTEQPPAAPVRGRQDDAQVLIGPQPHRESGPCQLHGGVRDGLLCGEDLLPVGAVLDGERAVRGDPQGGPVADERVAVLLYGHGDLGGVLRAAQCPRGLPSAADPPGPAEQYALAAVVHDAVVRRGQRVRPACRDPVGLVGVVLVQTDELVEVARAVRVPVRPDGRPHPADVVPDGAQRDALGAGPPVGGRAGGVLRVPDPGTGQVGDVPRQDLDVLVGEGQDDVGARRPRGVTCEEPGELSGVVQRQRAARRVQQDRILAVLGEDHVRLGPRRGPGAGPAVVPLHRVRVQGRHLVPGPGPVAHGGVLRHQSGPGVQGGVVPSQVRGEGALVGQLGRGRVECQRTEEQEVLVGHRDAGAEVQHTPGEVVERVAGAGGRLRCPAGELPQRQRRADEHLGRVVLPDRGAEEGVEPGLVGAPGGAVLAVGVRLGLALGFALGFAGVVGEPELRQRLGIGPRGSRPAGQRVQLVRLLRVPQTRRSLGGRRRGQRVGGGFARRWRDRRLVGDHRRDDGRRRARCRRGGPRGPVGLRPLLRCGPGSRAGRRGAPDQRDEVAATAAEPDVRAAVACRAGVGVGGAVLLDEGDGGAGRSGGPLGDGPVGSGAPGGLGEVTAQASLQRVLARRGISAARYEGRGREQRVPLRRVAREAGQAHEAGRHHVGAHPQPGGDLAVRARQSCGVAQRRGEGAEEAVAASRGRALGVGGPVGRGEDAVACEAVARSAAVGGRQPGCGGVAAVRGRIPGRGVRAGGPGTRRGGQRAGGRGRGAGREGGVEEAPGGEEHRVGGRIDGGGIGAVREEQLIAALTGHHGQRGAEDPRGEGGQQVGAAVVPGAALGRGLSARRPGAGRLARERTGQGGGRQRHTLVGRRPERQRETAEGVELGLLLRGQHHARAVQFGLGEGVGRVQGEGVQQILVAVLAQGPGQAVTGGADRLGADRRVTGGLGEAGGEIAAEQAGQLPPGLGDGEQRVEERGAVVRHVVHLAHRGAVGRGEGARGGVGGVGDRVRLRRLGPPSGRRVLLRRVHDRDGRRALVVGGEPGGGEVQPVVIRGGRPHAPFPEPCVVAGGLPGDDGRGLCRLPRQRGRQGRVAERAPLGRAQGEPGLPGPRACVVVLLLRRGEVGGRLGHVVPGGARLGRERAVVQKAVVACDVLTQPDQRGGPGLGGSRSPPGRSEGAERAAVGDPVVHLGHRQPGHRHREQHAAVGDDLDVGAERGVRGALQRGAVVRAADRYRTTGVGHTRVAVAGQRRGARHAFDVVGDAGLERVGGLGPLHGLHAGLVLHGEEPRAAAVHLRVEAGVGGVGLAQQAGGGLRGQLGAALAERLAEPGGQSALGGGLRLGLRGRRAEAGERGVAGHAHA